MELRRIRKQSSRQPLGRRELFLWSRRVLPMSRDCQFSALDRAPSVDDEDVAQAVLYLLSPAAAFVTGHVLVVDGGRSVEG